MRAAINMTQPSQKLGSWPASGMIPKNARLIIDAVPRMGKPSDGLIVSQPTHMTTAATAPSGLSMPA
jgi:hypothetical protein